MADDEEQIRALIERWSSVSLDITAGADVAFAHALLRRGTQAELED